jgi:hypothetical protein
MNLRRCYDEMMRKYVSLSVMILTLLSCDPCRNLDCISSHLEARLRFTDASGSNLLYGDNKQYQTVKLYSLVNNDTLIYEVFPSEVQRDFLPDTILHVYFNSSASGTVFVEFDASVRDTLHLSYERFSTECCGTITNITRIEHNHETHQNSWNSIIEIKR